MYICDIILVLLFVDQVIRKTAELVIINNNDNI